MAWPWWAWLVLGWVLGVLTMGGAVAWAVWWATGRDRHATYRPRPPWWPWS